MRYSFFLSVLYLNLYKSATPSYGLHMARFIHGQMSWVCWEERQMTTQTSQTNY